MVDVEQMEATHSSIPRGLIAGAPAVAGSTTPVTNDTGFDAMVRVNGGTVSAVKIDGVATGVAATGEWFHVRAGSTIELTYSSTPTWLWFHHG